MLIWFAKWFSFVAAVVSFGVLTFMHSQVWYWPALALCGTLFCGIKLGQLIEKIKRS